MTTPPDSGMARCRCGRPLPTGGALCTTCAVPAPRPNTPPNNTPTEMTPAEVATTLGAYRDVAEILRLEGYGDAAHSVERLAFHFEDALQEKP